MEVVESSGDLIGWDAGARWTITSRTVCALKCSVVRQRGTEEAEESERKMKRGLSRTEVKRSDQSNPFGRSWGVFKSQASPDKPKV